MATTIIAERELKGLALDVELLKQRDDGDYEKVEMDSEDPAAPPAPRV